MIEIFSKRLKELRKKNNLTQKKLADLCCMSQQVINTYENEKQFPRLESLILLAKSLNTTIDYLCGISELESSLDKKVLFKENFTSQEIGRSIVVLINSNLFSIQNNQLYSNEPIVSQFIEKINDIKIIENELKNKKISTNQFDIPQLIIESINKSTIRNTLNNEIHFEFLNNKKNRD